MVEVHARASRRSQLIRVGARAMVRPVLGFWPMSGPIAPAVRVLDAALQLLPRSAETNHERVSGDGWIADLVTPAAGTSGDGAIVYFHGGAFVFCGLGTHRRIVEELALRTGRPVLSVAYRQCPEVHVTQSVVDCAEAVNALIARGYDASELVLAGDSAGGHLAFATALLAHRSGVRVAGIAAMSPWLDFDNRARRGHRNAWRDPFIPTFRLDRVARHVTGSRVIDPELSPVNDRDLAALPPCLIMCAGDEVLRHDSELMAERLAAVDVPTSLHIWQGQVHAFPVLAKLLPEASAAVDVVADFVRERLAAERLAETSLTA